jgi:hypothetical protein
MTSALAELGLYGLLNAALTAVHWAFMNYVVGGVVAVLRRAVFSPEETRLERTLRDWLPFALSGLITAAVGPLLFTQLVRPVRYPSAAILLQHSYMAILPVLIVCFYLLYVLKGAHGPERRVRRLVTAAACLVGFVFIGWTISRNHVLSLRPDLWADVYAGRATPPDDAARVRTYAWFAWSLASFCALAQWQLGRRELPSRGLAATAILLLHVAVPLTYRAVRVTYGETDIPTGYVVAGVIGAGFQCLAWAAAFFGRNGPVVRTCLPVGWCVSLGVAALFREVAALKRDELAPFGAEVAPELARTQGFGLFAVCFVLVGAASAIAIRIARRAPPPPEAGE